MKKGLDVYFKEKTGLNNINLLELLFILIAISSVIQYWDTPELKTFSIHFFAIIVEALPFMLLGSLVSGLIENFLSRDLLIRFFNFKGKFVEVLIGACIGLIFPVCECAIVLVIRRLLKKGIPVGAAIAYLIAGPIFNPIVALSTLVAYSYQWHVMIIRLLSGVFIALIVGNLVNFLFGEKRSNVLLLDKDFDNCCDHNHCHHEHHGHENNNTYNVPTLTFFTKIKRSLSAASEDFFAVGKFLVIGAFVAALTQSFISREEVISWMVNPFLSIVMMMLMAFLLNLCSESDAFIAAAFRGSVIPLSAQMAFMVLGPMLDTKLIIMYLGVFKKRFILFFVPIVFLLVFLLMLALHFGGILS